MMIYKTFHPVLMIISVIFIDDVSSQAAPQLVANTSVLPPGWAGGDNAFCLLDCTPDFFLGPSFSDPVALTIESCVDFCDQQNQAMAAVGPTDCQCSNIFNPVSCFESLNDGVCGNDQGFVACPGNPIESCGLILDEGKFYGTFFKDTDATVLPCFQAIRAWPGGAALTAPGSWRFSNFYNDSITARALAHNSVNLPVPLPRGNLTTEACVAACGNAGFLLAGVEFADECYCGNTIQNEAQVITDCAVLPVSFGDGDGTLMRCKGNSFEFCGGPNIVSIYALPGSGLQPIVPFASGFDDLCAARDCVGNE